jgi:hypothetical protein
VFRRLLSLADDRGEGRSSAVLHLQLCELELRAGDSEAAARPLDEWDCWTAPEETDAMRGRCEALLAALRGLPEQATRSAAAALFEGDPKRAAESLGAVWEHTIRERVDDPGAFPAAPDLVEALVESGAADEAREVTDRLRQLAEQQEHPWGLATAKRCAAVVKLAECYEDEAAAALAAAATTYGELGLRFEQARSMLFLGRVQRRSKKRAAARHSLEEAGAVFDQLGCYGWAAAARSELARVSGRRAVTEGGCRRPRSVSSTWLPAGSPTRRSRATCS